MSENENAVSTTAPEEENNAAHDVQSAQNVQNAQSAARNEKTNTVPRARRLKMSLTQIDPWSVTKVSFMLLIAAALIQLIAVIFLYFVLQAAGIFSDVTAIVSTTGMSSGSFDLASVLSLGRVVSVFTIIAIFEIVVGTVLAAIGAFLYNITSSLVGGIHVTLGDD